MNNLEFRAWRDRMGLSLTGAAFALGKSRRTIASYQSGEYPVDGTVAKLCVELERREEQLWRRRQKEKSDGRKG